MRLEGLRTGPPGGRLLLGVAILLLLLACWLPLWSTRMEAPQYQGDEALKVSVSLLGIQGDIREVETLNQYIGVQLPAEIPELEIAWWVMVSLILAAAFLLVAPSSLRRAGAGVLLLAMAASATAAGFLLHQRLYELGHDRGPSVFARVGDFTPPLIGSTRIANFTVSTGLEWGAWAFLGAALLIAWVMVKSPMDQSRGVRVGRAAVAGLSGAGLLAVLFAGGLVLIPRYQAAHPFTDLQRSDANRVAVTDLYLDLTLVTPEFLKSRKLERHLSGRSTDSVLPVLVGLNTHTGSIEHMHHFNGQMLLVAPDGERFPSLTHPVVLSEHHNVYMLLFPSRNSRGERFLSGESGILAVEARGVGTLPVRRFEWELPIKSAGSSEAGPMQAAMLAVALIGALLVVLSPCAVELTLYYSAIASCAVADAPRQRLLMLNLGSFTAGFTLLYAAAGATVGMVGEGVRQPLDNFGVVEYAAGALILFFAARVLSLDRRLTRVLGRLPGANRFFEPPSKLFSAPRLSWIRSVSRKLRLRVLPSGRRTTRVKPWDSFLVGLGLSTSCLTCMGGAVLYPLLVYAGITSWYWGMITLGLYSLGIAIPMLLLALGFFQIHLTLSRRARLTRLLRSASGAMLGGIGVLILTGRENLITDSAFGLLGMITGWLA